MNDSNIHLEELSRQINSALTCCINASEPKKRYAELDRTRELLHEFSQKVLESTPPF